MNVTEKQPDALTRKEVKDLRVLVLFTEVYCRTHHPGERDTRVPMGRPTPGLKLEKHLYCKDCAEFLAYAIKRRMYCPLDPKPACKHCPVHCYKPDMREKAREVMRFAGPHLMKRGRIDLLWHYFF